MGVSDEHLDEYDYVCASRIRYVRLFIRKDLISNRKLSHGEYTNGCQYVPNFIPLYK